MYIVNNNFNIVGLFNTFQAKSFDLKIFHFF